MEQKANPSENHTENKICDDLKKGAGAQRAHPESDREQSFENAGKTDKKRKKTIRRMLALGAVLIVAAVAVLIILKAIASSKTASAGNLTYQVSMVSEGEINSTISGSGNLTASSSKTYAAGGEATVTSVNVTPGQQVEKGTVLLTLSSDSVQEQLDTLYDELDSLRTRLSKATQTASTTSSQKITTSRAGIVKNIKATSGSVVETLDELCWISTDGLMKLELISDAALQPYDTVAVRIGDTTVAGTVRFVNGQTATIVVEDDGFAVGEEATVADAAGTTLGSALLAVNEGVRITGSYGKIDTVNVTENQSVSSGTTLFTLTAESLNSSYATNKQSEQDIFSQIAELEENLTVTAPYDCIVTSVPYAVGQEVAAGSTTCTIMGLDGYTIGVNVDELDISEVSLGQTATITLDAVTGTYTGTVSNISYEGTTGSVTRFTATVKLDYIAGTYPGESASAEIVTATSGQTLIVPVDAVQYEGEEAFLYLATGENLGTSLDAAALDVSSLTRVTVETGMSDGSYIAVTGDISAGDLIWVSKLMTTSIYSSSEESDAYMTMPGSFGGASDTTMGGNFGGGEMPSGGMGGNRPSN